MVVRSGEDVDPVLPTPPERVTTLVPTGGAVGGDVGGGIGALLGGLLGGVAGKGGLDDLIGKFTGAGAGEQAESWVGTGENKPVDAATVEKALGADTVDEIAKATGHSKEEVEEGLAKALPKLVDSMTSEGTVPDDAALKAAAAKIAEAAQSAQAAGAAPPAAPPTPPPG